MVTLLGGVGVEREREREMGLKGRKRREKNFRAAHGGYNRLPPPPNTSSLDALPSKLRQIMAFNPPSQTPQQESVKASVGTKHRNKKVDGDAGQKKLRPNDEFDSEIIEIEEGVNDGHSMTPQHTDNSDEKRKGKKKRKRVNDLRFETAVEELGIVGLKKRERKKKYLEARKKKHKKGKTEENLDFPGREKIKFGDVVKAPPKLVAFPKASKTVQDASRERLRLQAIEAYRNRKVWVSRPGINLPPPVTTSPSI